MHRGKAVRWAAVVAAVTFAACASPPPTAPSATQIAGAWIANSTLSSVSSGGECVGVDLRNAIGRRDVFLAAIAGESSIQATITSQGNGTSCAYTGTNSTGGVTLTMGVCQSARVLNVACSSGARRDVQLVSSTLQARADSALGNGSGSETSAWNVLDSTSQQVVSSVSVTETFAWVYLGLPPSDYHVFTGTVFPGYADGTITIPADPNPWCLPCGWFH
jgi:hypothetical protein